MPAGDVHSRLRGSLLHSGGHRQGLSTVVSKAVDADTAGNPGPV